MKKWLIFLAFLPSLSFGESFSVKDLSGGLYTNQSGNRVPDNAASSIENFYTDVEAIAVERNGSAKRDATILGGTKSVPGLWEFQDNTGQDWIISFSSRSFYKNLVGGTPTIFGQLATADNLIPDCASNLGKFWCVNGTDSLWYFDGTSTATVSGAPTGSLIEPWRNRLIIGNISNARSTLRVSGEADGTDWTIASQSTSPFSISVGGANDGFNITALWKSYQDNFVIARKRDLWYLSGFSQSDWELRNVSAEIGCIQQGSMREFDGSLLFLSSRGMEELRGYTIQHISEPVRNITDQIVKNTSSLRSATLTSATDFGAGTFSPIGNISTTAFPGSMTAGASSRTITSAADWGSQVYSSTVYVDTETVSGNLQAVFPDTFTFLRNGDGGTRKVWTPLETNLGGTSTATIAGGTFNMVANKLEAIAFRTPLSQPTSDGTTCYFRIVSITTGCAVKFGLDDAENGSTTNLFATSTYTWVSGNSSTVGQITFGSLAGQGAGGGTFSISLASTTNLPVEVYFNFTKSSVTVSAGNKIMIATHSLTSLSRSAFAYFWFQGTASSGTVSFDNFDVQPQTFSFITSVLDTGLKFPLWENLGVSGDTTNIAFNTSVSADNVTFSSETVQPANTQIKSNNLRYIKMSSSFTVQGSTYPNNTGSLASVTIPATATGTFTSAAISIGSGISSWSQATFADSGSGITYSFNSSSNSDSSLFISTSWVTLVSGGVPTSTVKPYAAFRTSFTATTAVGTATVNDLTIAWNEGGSPVPPIVSWIYDRRYWLSYTTATASSPYNDRILVYQRNRTWTMITGINAASFATWLDNLYFGNSIGNGYVYKFDVGNSDDSSAIVSRITTKSYDLGVFNRDKDLDTVYLNYLGNSGFIGSINLSYDLDRSGNDFSLGSATLAEGTGQVSAKFPFPLSNPVQGREIQYKIVKNGTGDRLKLYELGTVFSILEEP